MKTRVGNVRTAEPGSYIYVGRCVFRSKDPVIRAGSPFGNPFKANAGVSLAEVLAKYRQRVLASPRLLALLPTLRGQVLGCWCCEWDGISRPAPECHACVLAELANGPLGD